MPSYEGIIKPRRYTIKYDDFKFKIQYAEKDPNGQWIFDPDFVINLEAPSSDIKAYKYITDLETILNSILEDATDDLKRPYKRLWPIRAENYRKAKKLLRNK